MRQHRRTSGGSESLLVSDAELVARVRSGDVEAFGQLAQRYERSVLAVVLSMLPDFHRAEDVVQATLLRAFQRLDTLRDKGKFGAWLIQIARSQVVDAVRARQVLVTVPLDESKHEPADAQTVRSLLDNEHLLSLVERLPDQERVLIGLRYFDGHSMAEIAAITARPIGTVTKQLSRASARLRSWWGQENRR